MRQPYETKDLFSAAYLVVAGHKLIETKWDGEKLYFVFPAGAERAVELFRLSKEGEYSKKLLRAYRTLHGMVLDERDRRATA